MAWHSGTQVEYTASGSNLNGGIFSSTITNAGTDYSLQDAAQVTGTDGACTTGTSTFTSASPSASFTSALIGNGLTIAPGTNFTASTYQITAVPDGNTLTLDRSPVGGSSGSSGVYKIGGAFAVPIDAHAELAQGGNILNLKGSGTFTLLASIAVSANNATAALPIIVRGYTTTRGDNPTGTDMPLIEGGTSYAFTMNLYWKIENVRLQSGSTTVLTTGNNSCTIRNCKATNNSATANRAAFVVKGSVILESEAISTAGYAISNDTNTLSIAIKCNVHDSVAGMKGVSFGRFNVDRCIFDTVTTGLEQNTAPARCTVTNSIFYNGSVAYDLGGSVNGVIEGNVFHSWTTALTDAATNLSNAIRRNDFYNNTNNATNLGTLDSSNLTSDPLFTDAPNKDFTVGSSSPLLNAGFNFALLGLTGAYKNNIGIDQDDNTAGGSGSATWAHASFG